MDSGGIQVEGGIAFRLKSPREIRRTTTVATAHFPHMFPAQRHLRGDVMIKLDAGAIRLLLGRERNVHRWFFLVSVVEEKHFVAAQPTGEERIPETPERFANPAD